MSPVCAAWESVLSFSASSTRSRGRLLSLVKDTKQYLHEPTLSGWPGHNLHAVRSIAKAPQWQLVHQLCLKMPQLGSVQATLGALKFRFDGELCAARARGILEGALPRPGGLVERYFCCR